MSEHRELEALFLAHVAWIDRVSVSVCRRHGIVGEDAADFAGWVKLRLVESDYAVLAKFRGESSLTTYLAVIVAMYFRDYRVQQWGRWRPSAAALKRGTVAVRLETLVHRDGVSLRHAANALRTAGETDLSDRDLASVLAELPVRAPLRPIEVSTEAIDHPPAADQANEIVAKRESEEFRQTIDRALNRALATLPSEDQVILRMSYWEGLSVADIARGLGLDQKSLYRRIERALRDLKQQLAAEGVSPEDVHTLLSEAVR